MAGLAEALSPVLASRVARQGICLRPTESEGTQWVRQEAKEGWGQKQEAGLSGWWVWPWELGVELGMHLPYLFPCRGAATARLVAGPAVALLLPRRDVCLGQSGRGAWGGWHGGIRDSEVTAGER